jgi:hypothetical protein
MQVNKYTSLDFQSPKFYQDLAQTKAPSQILLGTAVLRLVNTATSVLPSRVNTARLRKSSSLKPLKYPCLMMTKKGLTEQY